MKIDKGREPEAAFITSLVERIPGLKPVLVKHLKDQRDELLPHVLFWDVTQYFLSLVRGNTPASQDEAQAILQFLEDNYVDEECGGGVSNIILVSFIENLLWGDEATKKAHEMMGPRLKTGWKTIEDHFARLYKLQQEHEAETKKTAMGFKVGDKDDN